MCPGSGSSWNGSAAAVAAGAVQVGGQEAPSAEALSLAERAQRWEGNTASREATKGPSGGVAGQRQEGGRKRRESGKLGGSLG